MEKKNILLVGIGAAILVIGVLLAVFLGKDGERKPETAIDLQQGIYIEPLAGYTIKDDNGKRLMTDGECLIFLQGANATASKNWQKDPATEKIGKLTFNITKYRENAFMVRVDAHALESDVRLSLDNPAGFARCVTDFRTLLEKMGRE